jgi:integrase
VIEGGPFRLVNEAKDAMKLRLAEIEGQGGRGQDRRKMTFADLADYCLSKDGIYAEGKVRSRTSIQAYIKSLKLYFGKFLIRNITRESLRDYREKRLVQYRPTKEGDEKRFISEATANRELATLRSMLFYSIGEGWIHHNPFFKLRLLSTKNEIARDRILSREEEQRLLNACEGEHEIEYTRKWKGQEQNIKAKVKISNTHLRVMMILALDSGLRRNEIFGLRWDDIDLVRRKLKVRPENSKTNKGREAILSARAIRELAETRQITSPGRPFPYSDIKRSFGTAKRIAKIEDLRFHDLRRTHISRLQADGMATAMVGKAVGHSQLQTTMKHYTVVDEHMLDKMRERVDAFNSEPPVKMPSMPANNRRRSRAK